MLNLFIGLFLVCTSLGVSLSKFTKQTFIRGERKHDRPLTIERDVLR